LIILNKLLPGLQLEARRVSGLEGPLSKLKES